MTPFQKCVSIYVPTMLSLRLKVKFSFILNENINIFFIILFLVLTQCLAHTAGFHEKISNEFLNYSYAGNVLEQKSYGHLEYKRLYLFEKQIKLFLRSYTAIFLNPRIRTCSLIPIFVLFLKHLKILLI